MEHGRALFRSLVRAQDSCPLFTTEDTNVILEGIVSEVEVVKLAAYICLLLAFLNLLCPKSTVYMNKLVYLIGYQPASD